MPATLADKPLLEAAGASFTETCLAPSSTGAPADVASVSGSAAIAPGAIVTAATAAGISSKRRLRSVGMFRPLADIQVTPSGQPAQTAGRNHDLIPELR